MVFDDVHNILSWEYLIFEHPSNLKVDSDNEIHPKIQLILLIYPKNKFQNQILITHYFLHVNH